jgi:hypothetical protein
MNKTQLKIFKSKLNKAIKAHLASGGTLISGSFGSGTTLCPITCLVSESCDSLEEALSEKLGFTFSPDDLWNFMDAFDYVKNRSTNPIQVIARELRKKYIV